MTRRHRLLLAILPVVSIRLALALPAGANPASLDTVAALRDTVIVPAMAPAEKLTAPAAPVDTLIALAAPLIPADSTGLRLELGASTELSNEIFYEDDVDTTFLRPRLVASPQGQVSAVARVAWEGMRNRGALGFRILNDASVGTLTQSDVLETRLQNARGAANRMDLHSRLAYRHDRSFDRDLTEWRADGFGRLRSELGDDQTFGELGGRWDFGRTAGSSAAFLPDRNAGGAWIAVDRLPLTGADWRAGYSFMARAYPDSMVRDHLEHGWELQVRQELPGLASLQLETTGQRRVAIHAEPVPASPGASRDRYLSGDAAAELRWRPIERIETRTRFEGEWFRYDQPDSILYFDYHVLRASFATRLEDLGALALSAGPRLQWLRSPRDPAEAYDEREGALEIEWLGPGAWWSVAPAVGWRDYVLKATGNRFEDVGIHSSYWFLELIAFGEQALGARWHARATASARDEHHRDASQNARSLYFSLDIRILF